MDPLQILEKVNSFYSSAFSQLLTVTVIIFGFSGVILPIIWQIIQYRSFRTERKTLKSKITTDISTTTTNLKSEISDQFQKEKEQLGAYLKTEVETMNKILAEKISAAKAGTFYLQGGKNLDKKDYAAAACDFSSAANSFLIGQDERNGLKALEALVKVCIPELDSSSFENQPDLDAEIEQLLEILASRNDYGRFTDTIKSITIGRTKAKKRSPETAK